MRVTLSVEIGDRVVTETLVSEPYEHRGTFQLAVEEVRRRVEDSVYGPVNVNPYLVQDQR